MLTTIASWNVNSLRVRLPQLRDWLTGTSIDTPDIIALQETKLTDEDFPQEEIEALGYQVAYAGQRTYNGVAVLSREPIEVIATDIPGFDDPQRRVLAVQTRGLLVVDLYVPNGQSVDSDKYRYKLDWLRALHAWLGNLSPSSTPMIVLGDFNIAPEDRDVHDPAAWEGKVLVSAAERAALQAVLDLGLVDVYRRFDQPERSFSWWDYRAAGFRRNLGLRIDLILAGQSLAQHCVKSWIDKEPRRAERPSDHTPVLAQFEHG
jgi:exodeoxyribonuclease III